MKNLLRNLAYASVIVASLATAAHQLRGEATAFGTPRVVATTGNHVASSDGTIYERGGPGGLSTTWTPILSFGGLGSDVAAFYYGGGGWTVITESGDVWEENPGAGPRLIGNVFAGGGPTPASPSSWSQIKSGAPR